MPVYDWFFIVAGMICLVGLIILLAGVIRLNRVQISTVAEIEEVTSEKKIRYNEKNQRVHWVKVSYSYSVDDTEYNGQGFVADKGSFWTAKKKMIRVMYAENHPEISVPEEWLNTDYRTRRTGAGVILVSLPFFIVGFVLMSYLG